MSIKKEIFSLACSQIDEIKKNKILGKGTEGTAYLYCTAKSCDYVVKIQKNCDIEEVRREFDMNRKAYQLGLSYMIYQIKQCNDICLIMMDLAKGDTLYTYLKSGKTTIFNNVFKSLTILHNNGLYHGDLNPSNVFVEKKSKIKFIDFTPRYPEYKPYYDFSELFYYLPIYSETIQKNIHKLIFKELDKHSNDNFVKLINLIKNDETISDSTRFNYYKQLTLLLVYYNQQHLFKNLEDGSNMKLLYLILSKK